MNAFTIVLKLSTTFYHDITCDKNATIINTYIFILVVTECTVMGGLLELPKQSISF